MNVHFSSKTDMWATPQDTFDALAAEFGPFDLDVCATPENAKCPRYYTREDDGLAQPWTGRCWMNPPYGRTIGQWMKKAYEESQRGALVVCLVPARTDTAWWHDYAMKGQIRFLRGRLKFGGAANSAPFPSAVVVFANKEDRQVTQAEKLDAIADLYKAVYNATESFCEGGDMVGQTLYLIGAIVNEGTLELTRNDPYREFLHGIFPADSWIWNLVEDTD